MMVPYVSIFVLLLLAVVLLVVLTTIVVLLANPKTRKAAIAVLGVSASLFGLLIVFVVVGSFHYRMAEQPPTPLVQTPRQNKATEIHSEETTAAPAPADAKVPDDKPAWTSEPPKVVDDAYQMSIAIGPYSTRAECDAKLPEALQLALDLYVDVCLGDQSKDNLRLPFEYLKSQTVKEQWEETRQLSVGPMIWLHVLLQFDRKVKDHVLEAHRQAVVHRRLWEGGTWAAAVLAMLGTAFGCLKIDLATQGVYRRRLQIGAAAVILGLVVLAIFKGSGIGN